VPRTRIEVYPTPAPASDVVITDGVDDRINGKSSPKFWELMSAFDRFEKATGVVFVARVARTSTF